MNAKRTTAEIITLPGHNKRTQYLVDAIFFAKDDIRIGTKLRNIGNTQQGSTWRVVSIHTFKPTGVVGEYRRVKVDDITKLSDQVTMQRETGGQLVNEKRTQQFHGLKYSALWRLV